MPIFTTLTGAPSNKQGEAGIKKVGEIPLKKISYIPIKGQVAVLKPILDKISITYKIADPDLQKTLVQSLLQEIEAGGHWDHGPFKMGPVVYSASGKLNDPTSGHEVTVQAGPKKKSIAHGLRLEFNPDALGSPGIAFLKTQLETLVLNGLNFNDIIANGVVTRLDVAVDVVGIHLADLLLLVKTEGKQHWYFSGDGKPETGYLGMKKTDKSAKLKAYNKRQELKDHSKVPVAQAYGGLSHTRVEYTFKTPNKSFLKLTELKNPFDQISLAYPKAPKGVKPYSWTFFIDSCVRRGQTTALAMIPDGKLRNSYQKAIDESRAIFWRPDEIWKAWDGALVNSSILQA
jgi:hypothetical protein